MVIIVAKQNPSQSDVGPIGRNVFQVMYILLLYKLQNFNFDFQYTATIILYENDLSVILNHLQLQIVKCKVSLRAGN